MTAVRVAGLARYPVKSMSGERLERLQIDHRGVVGDRLWAVRTATGKIGSGKNTRRFATVPGLLELRATVIDGRIIVRFPDGNECEVEDPDVAERISRWVGMPVTLQPQGEVSHFDDGPVSLIGRGSVDTVAAERQADIDPLRFRANILVDGSPAYAEDGWIGRRVRIGTATLEVSFASPRCVMLDLATADLPAQPGNLLAVGRTHDACLGVIAQVVTPGTVAVGDEVTPCS